ncbi:hypothetical protein BJX66DRAFT_320880 [Aspergillus keveii]|uniref:GRF-like zinc ribbon domain-containing protein n=1 Tax=Aspergillus keveii TaxID=714993 RepID=A0ABR4FGL7_9EURO
MATAIPRLFARAPQCCGHDMHRRPTRSNENGNVNRPHYRCRRCRDMVFDDWEGIREGNPLCFCEEVSRGQVESGYAFVFRCARNECEFKEELVDED